MFDLTGKKAVVTGASRETGICFALAKALREAGAQIVLLGGSEERLQKTVELAGGEAAGYRAIPADLTDAVRREAAYRECLDWFGGRLDILVNGAGAQHRCPAVDFPAEEWERVIAVNLSSMFYLCQLAGRTMIAQGKGKIINIASMNSFFGGGIVSAYSSSKGGVVQLTKALSNEWMPKGVNVNAIAPGFIKTELSDDMRVSERGQAIARRIPAGGWGEPEVLGGAAVYLASAASDYVSGIVLPVDGGYLCN